MRKILSIRERMLERIERLKGELEDMRMAVEEIDRYIVRQGFRHPAPPRTESEEADETSSIKTKDGSLLGRLTLDEANVVFVPREGIPFDNSMPPFQSFLIDKVLQNMKKHDEERVKEGEISPEDVLSYEVVLEEGRLLKLMIRNFGGERRLREIRSSLRWTFEKMYEKLEQG
jgi:hypothetical protein